MKKRRSIEVAAMLLAVGIIGLGSGAACFPCPLTFAGMLVRGALQVDGAITLGDFDVSAMTWTDGNYTGDGATRPSYSDDDFTWADGTFQVFLASSDRVAICDDPFSENVEVPEYPVPDELHLVVIHGGCEHTFEIPVTADMLTDYDYPEDDVLQLTEPLVIGACPEG